MALFYIFDEFTDKVDGKGALAHVEVVVDALRNPYSERPPGESKLGEITRQLVLSSFTTWATIDASHVDSGCALCKRLVPLLRNDSLHRSQSTHTQS
jgi:hypothetical protein